MAKPRAVGNNIVVKIDPDDTFDKAAVTFDKIERTVKVNGIVTSATAEDYFRELDHRRYGLVVDIGPCAYNLEWHGDPWCKVGDYILFTKYEGTSFKDEKENVLYRIIIDTGVRGVLTEE